MLNLVNALSFATSKTYTCGTGEFTFEGLFPQVVSIVVTVIKIGIPVLLIILGMIDLGKSVMAQKEDEIKKAQGLFIKRLIAAILVFLVVFIVQIVVRFIAKDDSKNVMSCINCFINGETGNNSSEKAKGCWLVK